MAARLKSHPNLPPPPVVLAQSLPPLKTRAGTPPRTFAPLSVGAALVAARLKSHPNLPPLPLFSLRAYPREDGGRNLSSLLHPYP